MRYFYILNILTYPFTLLASGFILPYYSVAASFIAVFCLTELFVLSIKQLGGTPSAHTFTKRPPDGTMHVTASGLWT